MIKRFLQHYLEGIDLPVSIRAITLPAVIAAWLCLDCKTYAQPELMAWGNLTGIRTEGQLMEFESSLRVVDRGWTAYSTTGKEKQQPSYHRSGNEQIVTTAIGKIKFTERVKDCGNDCADISVVANAERDTLVEGSFFCIALPGKYFSDADVHLTNSSGKTVATIKMSALNAGNNYPDFKKTASGISVDGIRRNIEITTGKPVTIYLRKMTGNADPEIYFTLSGGRIKKGREINGSFRIKAGGTIDTSSVKIDLDSRNPGRKFAGLGGNFRLQNPSTDPQVIQYCIDNIRVAWGRVEMPWYVWQPDENADPVEAAKAGNLHPHARASMEMARKLAALGIPVIVSDWGAPAWAILGDPRDAFRNRSKGIYGYQLNPEKMQKIYKSIGQYLLYLKDYYGVEAAMFSFNESDLGINVRHTGEEHDEFIKNFGSYLASLGLSTKLLLGDNSDATTYDFIVPALNDPESYRYIGAVSFHSWRGCTDEILAKWAAAARQLNLPLIVAEGSTDAAAWKYPEIFSEQSFAIYEINLYLRICTICQPLSILQWQMTADYSVMTGAGIFGTEGPLKPTQRYWNLKQLSSSPVNAFSIPLTCSKESINCAAFSNAATGGFAVHIVNNGAKCQATVTGIPPGIDSLEIYQTDGKNTMEMKGNISVTGGTAELPLDKYCFTTLLNSTEK
jgi:hypothetical protein